MKRLFATAAILMSCLAGTVSAQTPIVPPPGGIAIVSGGHYAAGTVFANGMAYPAGAVVQASAVATPTTAVITPSVYTYRTNPSTYYPNTHSYYPGYGNRFYNSSMIGVGYGNGYGQYYGFNPNAGQWSRYGWNTGYYNPGLGRYNTGYGGFYGGRRR